MMISYMIDGQGFLNTNREIVSEGSGFIWNRLLQGKDRVRKWENDLSVLQPLTEMQPNHPANLATPRKPDEPKSTILHVNAVSTDESVHGLAQKPIRVIDRLYTFAPPHAG
ncbi:hypothetical protein LTR95_019365, partial [Oleoguttula sp. CCFEE 5521]